MAKRRTKISTISGGVRPDFAAIKKDSKTFIDDFKNAMYYVHYELTDKKLRNETLKYAKSKKLDTKVVDAAQSKHFMIIGKVCYILNRGGEVPEEYDKFVESQLQLIIETGQQILKEREIEREETPAKKVTSIQDRLRDQAAAAAEDIDVIIDQFLESPGKFKPDDHDIYTILTRHELKSGHAHWVIKFFENDKAEILEAIDGECPQLKEAYGRYTKPQLKKLITLYDKIETASGMLIEAAKVTRKPRKKKAVSADRLVSNLKYQKEDKALGLVSVSPRDIIGATELWVYNTKTRKLGKYVANGPAGLSVKGTTIQEFATDSAEKTLRKPAEQLKEFKGSGKVALRKFMDNIKTIDTKLKGRLNEHHIILKIVQ